MLVQSHDGAIDLLPAIPQKWSSGSFNGFNTREDATVDLSWDGGKPTEAKIHSRRTGDISIRTKYASEAKVYDESGAEVTGTLNDQRNLLTFPVVDGKTYTINNFGSNVEEGDKYYYPKDVKEFFASDSSASDMIPKPANDGTEIGWLYRRNGVKIGYAVNDFNFDGLAKLVLNMPKVRDDNIYVSITVDSKSGTEIANQLITTGDNELELKNLDGINGEHKIYLSYYQEPYNSESTDKYLGNAGNLVGSYSKNINPDDPTSSPKPTAEPDSSSYSSTG